MIERALGTLTATSDSALQGEWIPSSGQWPVGPQEDVAIDKSRIWVDGCFDFSHHGMLRDFASAHVSESY